MHFSTKYADFLGVLTPLPPPPPNPNKLLEMMKKNRGKLERSRFTFVLYLNLYFSFLPLYKERSTSPYNSSIISAFICKILKFLFLVVLLSESEVTANALSCISKENMHIILTHAVPSLFACIMCIAVALKKVL